MEILRHYVDETDSCVVFSSLIVYVYCGSVALKEVKRGAHEMADGILHYKNNNTKKVTFSKSKW